jgi:hypothetical protein
MGLTVYTDIGANAEASIWRQKDCVCEVCVCLYMYEYMGALEYVCVCVCVCLTQQELWYSMCVCGMLWYGRDQGVSQPVRERVIHY